MFTQEHIELFGQQAIRFHNNSKTTAMTIIPTAGGHLASLIFHGEECLDGFQNENELAENAWGKSGLLYPFPNRLKQGAFEFDGQQYQFPVNDLNTGNALHGFGMEQSMQVEQVEVAEKFAQITLSYDYDGSLDYYPWPFKFSVGYRLAMDNSLKVTFYVKNTGTAIMPFGMGWHPYFLIHNKGKGTALKLPKMNRVEIDQFMIPTGNKQEFDIFEKQKLINDYSFDTGFSLNGHLGIAEVKISNEALKPLTFWQEGGEHQFRFLQVFIPPARNAIALEPMTCNIDAFNNQEGLWCLQPEEERAINCGLKMG